MTKSNKYNKLLSLRFVGSLTLNFSILATSLLAVVSCSDEYTGGLQATTNPKYLNVDKSSLTYQSTGGEQQLGIQCIGTSWTLGNTASWISLDATSGSESGNVRVAVDGNTEYSDRGRSAVVTLSGNGMTDRLVNVTQESPALLLEATPSEITIPASASASVINVVANNVWTVSVAYDWLTATSSGNTVTLNAKENTTGSMRENTVSIQSGSKSVKVKIIQKAAVVTVSPQTLNFDYTTSSQDVTVTSDVSWSVSKPAEYDWITLSQNSGIAGTGTVKVSVADNASESPRTGTFSIGNTVVTVNQKAFKSELSVSSPTVTMKGGAEKAIINVTSNSAWNYTVSENHWLTVERESSELRLTASENVTESTRSAIINITAGTKAVQVEVTQLPASISGLSEHVEFGYESSSKSFTVSSEAAWQAATNYSWIQISPSSGRAGDAAIKVSVTENASKESRIGSFTVNNTTVKVSQSGVQLTHSPEKLVFSEDGETIHLTVTSNTKWSLTPNKSWIQLDKTEGTGNAVINVSVGKNTDEPRDGRIRLESSNGVKEDIDVEQSGMGIQMLVLSPFVSEGDKISFEPNSLVFSSWKANVESGTTWLHITPESGNSSAKLTITVDKTNDVEDRSSYIDIIFDNGKKYRLAINQYGAGIICETTNYSFFAKGGTSEAITVSHKGDVSVSSSANWLTARLVGDLLTLTASENLTGSERKATVTLSLAGTTTSITITVTQARQHGDFSVEGYGEDITLSYNVNPMAVDLGLSVKWAICNVGASKPEDYGDYYAWGEIETKSDYRWNTYLDSPNRDGRSFTKYDVDKKTVLDPEDDVAHVKWGGSWRMPTTAELNELRKKCTWTLTTQNGVNGYVVTGPNGNSIFLPAAGVRDFISLYQAGSDGYYWSSSLNTSHSIFASDLYFKSSGVYEGNYDRCYGLSVRPVCP